MITPLGAATVAALAVTGTGGNETSTHLGIAPEPVSAPADDNELGWYWKDGLRLKNSDGSLEFKFGGRILYDMSWISADDDFKASGLSTEDGTEFRAARLFVEGELYDEYFFKLQVDFAGQVASEEDVAGGAFGNLTVETEDKRPAFKDVYIGKRDVFGTADVKVGHYKEPFSLDQLTSSRFITFAERSMADAFVPSRNDGISVYDTALDDNLTWALGVFRTTDDAGFNAEDGGYSVTGRLTGTPLYENDGERLVHLGASYSMRDDEGARFRARPEAHLSDRFADAKTSSDDVDLMGIELAGVFGPFHTEAEYMQAAVDGASGAADPDFDGYYVQAGYFLTGETRSYKRSGGTFDRTKPTKSWSKKEGGMGALEAALRYSSIDLTDAGISGGEVDNVTVGLNWYLNSNMRLMANYVMSDVENGSFDESADIFLVRFQVDW